VEPSNVPMVKNIVVKNAKTILNTKKELESGFREKSVDKEERLRLVFGLKDIFWKLEDIVVKVVKTRSGWKNPFH